ncbi:MAG: F0F1 ATP synthase subunit B [bacterium]
MLDFLKEGLLEIQPGMLVWTLITFGLVVFVLWKYVWNTILGAIDTRADKIIHELQRAEEEREVADGLLEENKRILLKAKEEAMEIVSKAKSRTVEIKDNTLNQTKKEAEQLVKKAYRDIEQIRRKELYNFKKELVEITFRITNKFVQKQIDISEGARLVDQYLEEYKENVIRKQ